MLRGPSNKQQFEAFEIGHMVFFVLDFNQPNPLFHAPIGDSPKVNFLRRHSLKRPLISRCSIFWTSELVKGVRQCNPISNMFKKTINESLVTLPIAIR
ncbi:hypothetical protein N7499_013041 [Penicillium canescens]|nr:hypothetical protein N7499_013041 [Penicillium canescens]KAJ6154141.1 hypothetical protein N7485_012510 [Penicillium canescens]